MRSLRKLILFTTLLFVAGCSDSKQTARPVRAPTPIHFTPNSAMSVYLDAYAWKGRDPENRDISRVEGDSMQPFMNKNVILLLLKYTGQHFPDNTTITFLDKDKTIVHVVTKQDEKHFWSQGANNEYPDGMFPKTAIQAIVVGQLSIPSL